jgi:ABC-type transport system involved in cytochrome c biogenesis permease subunit
MGGISLAGHTLPNVMYSQGIETMNPFTVDNALCLHISVMSRVISMIMIPKH